MRATRPTRRQKILISGFGLNGDNFLVVKETDGTMELYNKKTKKTITRYKKEKNYEIHSKFKS